ncbi:MAG: hypothetical protein WC246_00820 [Candidatus Paceibacterota bacterium]|jgi:hypothetical protein
MNNFEDASQNEQGKEHIPAREEILAQIHERCESAEIIRELADTDGVYLLEAREQGKKPGEFTDYIYQRKGTFPGHNDAEKTVLEKVYFEDDMPCGGDIIAEYDDTTRTWIEK